MNVKTAEKILKACAGKRVLVIGDLMLDRYVTGSVSRLSPEAPVPVIRVSGERALPGGAANVALNIQSLGGQAVVAGVVGKDRAGHELTELLSQAGIETTGVVVCPGIQTTVKTRIIAERQQVVRVDREDLLEPSGEALRGLCKRVAEVAGGVHGIVLEDYGKGVITQGVADSALSAARTDRLPVGFDPKENETLRISGVTLATPNYKEACFAAGVKEGSIRGDPATDEVLQAAGLTLMKKWAPELLMITLGPHGMYLLSEGQAPEIIPTKAREVFDVSGAGDTVIATALLAVAGGATYREAAILANHAAGVVVGKLGTATCSPAELLESMD